MIVDDGDPWRKKMKRQDATRVLRWITFSCEKRLPLFKLAATRDAFVEAMLREAVASKMGLVAFVIMPEHVHMILNPRAGRDVAVFLRRLKSRFARDTLAEWALRWPEAVQRLVAADGSRRFWLRGGGYDRSMWREEELAEKVAYCHGNPVRRGLVARPRDWRWSSAGIAYPRPEEVSSGSGSKLAPPGLPGVGTGVSGVSGAGDSALRAEHQASLVAPGGRSGGSASA